MLTFLDFGCEFKSSDFATTHSLVRISFLSVDGMPRTPVCRRGGVDGMVLYKPTQIDHRYAQCANSYCLVMLSEFE